MLGIFWVKDILVWGYFCLGYFRPGYLPGYFSLRIFLHCISQLPILAREWLSTPILIRISDSHLTIFELFDPTRTDYFNNRMVFAVEKLKFILNTCIYTCNLTIFEPTWLDPTRLFDICSDSYSTNLPLNHSLILAQNSKHVITDHLIFIVCAKYFL